ncbi:43495_t:CDS:1 [Gigaspora margarita]|uniref:43495_t:CDS:1 n=1 Tax=Gigaspora margarita TaxID=4874 RepID=A0ABM8VZB8_GIGMA|nr:43495_t:CDS:1 [Gigaspora margarita]
METEPNQIPEKDYNIIEENSSRLNISTGISKIIYKYNEFLTKHSQRRCLDKNSNDRINIEKENRAFLEEYWEVYQFITYWYGYYLNEGIGGDRDEKKAIKLFKQVANKNVSGAQLRYAFSFVKNNSLNRRDLSEFITYLSKSANNNNNKAQYEFGKLYYFGNLVSKDKEQGKKFLILALKMITQKR